jgi:nitrous oxidase accessory protein
LKEISDSRVTGNVFSRNTIGLYAEGSSRLSIEDNDFVRNGWAVRVLGDSTGIGFAHNRFAGNTFEVTTNSSRSQNTFVENYWADYRGYDLDRDGIGDVPYRPVRLFALLVEQFPQAIVLLRSPLIELLDLAERVIPILIPQVLADARPLTRSPSWSRSAASKSPSRR